VRCLRRVLLNEVPSSTFAEKREVSISSSILQLTYSLRFRPRGCTVVSLSLRILLVQIDAPSG
jgi:hypothetical protein